MIKINNNIDNNCKALIYYKDKLIGECLNELAFLDVRYQIGKEQDENYSFILINPETNETSDKIKFDKDGFAALNKLYWNNYENILMKLLGV